jgi:signal transduction histidine kinase
MVSYLGFPLAWPDGELFGAISVLDTKENPFSGVHQRLIKRLKEMVDTHLALLFEITERRRAEDSLRQRTAELQSVNEELAAFAHTVAHDLKAPLSLITGYSGLLEDECDTLPLEELRLHLRTIAESSYRMGGIIDELLLLATVRRGEEVPVGPLEMTRIVAAARERLTLMIGKHQAEITIPDSFPVAVGHGAWVEAVWANYLSNAIKYGGRPPRVEIGATEQSDGTVRFWVRDNGSGLAPDEQEQLFTPFTRLDNVRASGHGLGLSIVQHVVDLLGGEVGVESELDQGSLFYFTLPQAEPPSQALG